MEKVIACKMPKCDGTIDRDLTVCLRTGCSSFSTFFACNKCGRIHSAEGTLIFNRPGAAAYRREDGSVDLIMEPISFDIGKKYKTTNCMYVSLEGVKIRGIPQMASIDSGTTLIFDGMAEEMFRFHSELGDKLLLHRGDVNFVESAIPEESDKGKTYVATSHVHVCLEGKDGDCVVADMVELPQGTQLTFDSVDGDKYRFHGEDGTEYHLHTDDLDKIEKM